MIELEGFIVREGLMIILGDVKLLSVYILIFNCDSQVESVIFFPGAGRPPLR